MRTPREIYAAYKIMPSLQLHQLRVAAVGKLICDNFTQPIEKRDVILACLFHDMGNILKSDLTYFSDMVEPEGLAYWEQVKKEYMEKYDGDVHTATGAIAKEIGLPRRVGELIRGVGYSKMARIVLSNDLEQKICQYADTRVGPHGVLSQKDRMLEGKQRFDKGRMLLNTPYYSDQSFDELVKVAEELEIQIFARTDIKPEDISDAAVAPIVEELWEYPLA